MTRRGEFFWSVVIFCVLLFVFAPLAHCQACVTNSMVTLTGNLRGSNGIPAKNYVMTLAPSQQGYIAGCGVNLPTGFQCGTSTDGSVVGIPNPLTPTVNTTSGGGFLTSGVYYTVYEFYDAAGHVTLPSPETRLTLSVTESLVVNPPASGMPSNAVGIDVFIGTSSGAETLQGQTTGTAAFVQSTALTSGASPASTNTTLCQVTANDSVWPVGTGYNVNLVDSQGNPVPQYPMQWQLLGAGTTYNLSNGLPYYHGIVFYPVPILAQPANHGTQSISGSLNLGGYNLLNAGKVGVGTATPGWPLDVENGLANFQDGLILGGVAPTINYCAASSTGVAIDEYVACITSIGTIYYQTLEANGTAETQRPAMNFSQRFTLADSSGPARTNIDLNAPGTGNIVATETATPGASTNCATYDGNGNLVPSAGPCTLSVVQKNCLSVSCAGGSTYASGTVYTNSSGVPVLEEVTFSTTGAGGCVGNDSSLTTTINSVAGPAAWVTNACTGQQSVTFLVPVGGTFSATVTHVDGSGATPSLTGWLELSL